MIGQVGNIWRVKQLLFVDDSVLIRDSEENLRELLKEFDTVYKRIELKLNAGKS